MAIEQREADAEQTGQIILEQVRQLATELRPALSSIPSASLDSLLDRELGFDSLGRVELISRIERALGISLPEHLLTTAETPRDLMRAVQQGVTSTAPYRFSPTQRPTDHGGANATPASANSLLEVLEWHGRAHPARPHIYLVTQSGAEEEISYAALRDGAAAVAAGLRERDLRPGQTVAIMLPTGRDYFYSFYGVLMAGGI
ncbi:MAG: AMP-binding protein, partial [Gammaproteobacteria bacterium]|nr:AMP-binding protein [Gammaproteobacteria bacterium]